MNDRIGQSPNRPQDNQQYHVPIRANVIGGANSSDIDFGAFYNDILPYYSFGGSSQPDRLPQGDPPGWPKTGSVPLNFVENNMAIVPFPIARPTREGETRTREEVIAVFPTGGTDYTAPNVYSSPTFKSPFDFSGNVTMELPKQQNPFASFMQGLFGQLAGRALNGRSPVTVQGNTVSVDFGSDMLARFGVGNIAELFSNPDVIPAEWQMPQYSSTPTFTQEIVDAKYNSGALNQESYEALSSGRTSYVLNGTVLPTTSIGGGVRNTYGDTGGSLVG